MHLGEHDVRLCLGEIAATLDRRQLRRIAEHQHLLAEGEQVAAEFLVDHGTFVDDDQLGAHRVALVVEDEGRLLAVNLLRTIDQAVDGARILAATRAHDERGLAGIGGENNRSVEMFGEMARQGRLARAREAEQAKHLWLAALQPG